MDLMRRLLLIFWKFSLSSLQNSSILWTSLSSSPKEEDEDEEQLILLIMISLTLPYCCLRTLLKLSDFRKIFVSYKELVFILLLLGVKMKWLLFELLDIFFFGIIFSSFVFLDWRFNCFLLSLTRSLNCLSMAVLKLICCLNLWF